MWLWLENTCIACSAPFEWMAPEYLHPLTCGSEECIRILYTGAGSCIQHRRPLSNTGRRWTCMLCVREKRKPEPKKRAPAQCLHCETPAEIRGLCMRCYRRFSLRVHRKTATWAQLEADGLVLNDCRKSRTGVGSL